MDYGDFCDCLKKELPLNRKERFFTATVLPALLFHNGLKNLFSFLTLIDDFPSDITLASTQDQFLFYTEYNLQESAGSRGVGARISVANKDTPDIVIEILRPRKVFVVIEAKMFHNVAGGSLIDQIHRQKERIGNPIVQHYGLSKENLFFVALLPRQLGIESCSELSVIYWEDILNKLDCSSNFFYNYLKYALDNYKQLVSINSFGTASTVEFNLRGQQIYVNREEMDDVWVGRKGGELKIIEDIKTGKWRSFDYSMNSAKPDKGRPGNWIDIERFCELVDQYSM